MGHLRVGDFTPIRIASPYAYRYRQEPAHRQMASSAAIMARSRWLSLLALNSVLTRFNRRMGEVYRARDTRLDRIVAIKILPANLSSNPDMKQRFEREARAISALNHPHRVVSRSQLVQLLQVRSELQLPAVYHPPPHRDKDTGAL